MEQGEKTATGDEKNTDQIKSNKGGRPKGQRDCAIKKVTLYLTEEEYALLTEFAKTAWYKYNYSGAASYFVLDGLKSWVKKGRPEIK